MKRYVLGFAFWNDNVALIHKQRGPAGLIGKWNGIGGKIEDNESPDIAMVREFAEETDFLTIPSQWNHYGTYGDGINWSIELFSTIINDYKLPHLVCKEEGGEKVAWFRLDLLDCPTPMMNLLWLVPMARLSSISHVTKLDITEKVV